MASQTTMNVSLSPDLYRYVKAAVKSGRYSSASEFIREALRSEREQILREIEAKIEAGLESARRGNTYDGESVIAELEARSLRRRAPSKARG